MNQAPSQGPAADSADGALKRLRESLSTDPVQRVVALILTFLIPISAFGLGGIATLNLGIVLALVIIPIWFRFAGNYRGSRILQIAMVLSVVSGLLLLLLTQSNHEINLQRAAGLPATILFSALTLGFLLWVRGVTDVASMGVAYGAGALLDSALRAGEWGELGWKYGYSWPCAVILLSLVIGRKYERVCTALVMAALVALSIGGGYRSLVAFCIVAFGLYLFISWNSKGTKTRRLVRFVLVASVTPIVSYLILSWLLLSGLLGADAQTRTEEQIAESGSLLAGGRQEWAAAFALFARSPMGFGPGIVPNADDIATAKQGLSTIGGDIGSYHTNVYVLGGMFRLHSIASDLWSNFGLVGLATALLILVCVVWYLVSAGMNASTTALQVLLAIWAVWDILFSPIDSNWRYLIFALALLLVRTNFDGSLDRTPAFARWGKWSHKA